ncbi:MAG: hypothetical protein GY705_01180 [Bacteroidetes bacterium]|nr:hypothetical protein [Bacteroidota bacterium]
MKAIFGNPILLLVSLSVIISSMGLLSTSNYLFALAPPVFAILFLLLWKKPYWGFFIIIFLLPFDQYTTLSATYKFLTIPKFVGILTISVFLLQFFIDRDHEYNITSNLWPLLFAFFFICVFSTMLSEYSSASFDAIRKLITAYAMFVLTLGFISRKRLCQTLPVVIITSATISALVSLYGFAANNPLFLMDMRTKYMRFAGGAGDPNEFATMLIFAFPLFSFLIWKTGKTFKSLCLAALFSICAIAVILTYSRAGALIMVATLGLLFFQYIKEIDTQKFGFILLFVGVVAVIAALVIPESYWRRQKTVTNYKTDFSVGRRLSYLVFAYDKFKDSPVLGYGPGTFKSLYATSDWTRHFEQKDRAPGRAAHNSYVEVALGTGTIGLILFLTIIAWTFRNYYASWKIYSILKKKEMCRLTTSYAISFTVILLAFLFLSLNFHKFFWISLGLSQLSLRYAKKSQEKLLAKNLPNTKKRDRDLCSG